MIDYFYILGRILANPMTNVMQKKLTNRQVDSFFIVFASYTLLTVMGIMLFSILRPTLSEIDDKFWVSILLASVIDAAGNIFSVKSLREIELSVFGPLNAYKPVVATATAALLLQEFPSWLGLLGIFIVIIGSILLNYKPKLSWKETSLKKIFHARGFWFRLLAILLYSISVVYLKESIIYSSPLITLIFWSLFGWIFLVLLSLLFALLKSLNFRENIYLINDEKKAYFGLTFFFFITQLFTLLVFKNNFVGYSLAIFQLSALLNIFLGHQFFREKNIRFKLIGTLVMVIGIILIMSQ